MSFKAATESPLTKVALPEMTPLKPVTLDPKWLLKVLQPSDIDSVIPDAGVVIINLKGISAKNGVGISLVRMGADKNSFPSATDHAPDQLGFYIGTLFAKKTGNLLAIAAPPGRWRIASIGLAPALGFCLGAPSFNLEVGQVVYAGAFDLSGADLGQDLSLDAPKAWLAGQPAAQSILPAVYTNGAEGPCGYNGIYALEIEGAPFEPGYTWGSAATKARPAEAAPQ
ncbi:hypothetical protein [Asticcacaulis biprosthecium]|uniref:hypothetical protein n=1 Tax=Asticcacaulis biprosthecium TaxID=76891 RepID=UPI0002DF067F|nr:hypothetical protein [Asticcacaulis biprosthecium]